jgi:cyclase
MGRCDDMTPLKSRIERLGERASVVTFHDPYVTNVCVILGHNSEQVFVLDTFLGPESMKIVKKAIDQQGCGGMPVTVFNSHADYDHVWGNCTFSNSPIIGHDICRQRVIEEFQDALRRYSDHRRGKVEILPPNITFSHKISFPVEGITLEHTPGHTPDSSSCHDAIGSILFVGDNIESPAPFVNSLNFDTYIGTLRGYLELEWEYLLSGHDPLMRDDRLILQNLEYLESLRTWEFSVEGASRDMVHVHLHNLDRLSDELLKTKIPEGARAHYQTAMEYLESGEDLGSPELLKRIRRVVH